MQTSTWSLSRSTCRGSKELSALAALRRELVEKDLVGRDCFAVHRCIVRFLGEEHGCKRRDRAWLQYKRDDETGFDKAKVEMRIEEGKTDGL